MQAGTQSWKAFLFGSFDPANFITVDKPPGLAVGDGAVRPDLRVQLLEHAGPAGADGVACVGVLYAAVRRWFGPAAGLVAGLALALTPVAALMFRFNNPDALLVLLLMVAAYSDGPRDWRTAAPAGWCWPVC